MTRYLIELPAVIDSLNISAPFTDAVLHELPDIPERESLIHDLALVSCEALTNAIRHGKRFDLSVRLVYLLDSAGITIKVTDFGDGFYPENVPLPDFEGAPVGGFGIYILKSIMDDVSYEKSSDGNTLTLVKKWGSSDTLK